MSDCRGCGASLDCGSDPVFPYSVTGSDPLPFVLDCPTGFNCRGFRDFIDHNGELIIVITCVCGPEIIVEVPSSLSDADRNARIAAGLAQCTLQAQGCGTDGEPPATKYYYNDPQTATKACSNGGTYSFTVPAGSVLAKTRSESNKRAKTLAQEVVKAYAFCLAPPTMSACKDAVTTFSIPTVRGTTPFSAIVTSGALPTGMTLLVSGGTLKVTGTPTVAGTFTPTLKVTDGVGGYLTKSLTMTITNCASGQIYYALGTTTGGIAVDSFGSNNTDLNQGARTLISGPIVSAWLFNSVVPPVETWFDSSTLSDKTKITGKSITIRMWVKCLEPVTVFQTFHKMVLATRYFSIQITNGALNGAWNKSPDTGSGYGFLCFANGDAVDDGNWHRIIFVYNATTGEARFQVDNNTPTLETVDESLIVENGSIAETAPAVPDVVAVQLCPYYEITGGGNPPPYDSPGYYAGVDLAEIYIAPGVVWSDADCTYDWNGGAGRTYPNLP